MRTLVLVLVMAGLTAGCAFGRKQEFDSAPLDVKATSQTVSVGVLDHRPYVLDNDKPETFTGLSRSGAGIPFNIHTGSGHPLADDMATALANSLRAKGAAVNVVILAPTVSDTGALAKVATPGGKGLLVVVKEWKSDTYVNTDLAFDLRAVVVDPSGRSVGETATSGLDHLPYEGLNTRVSGPVKAFREKMRQLLATPAIASQL